MELPWFVVDELACAGAVATIEVQKARAAPSPKTALTVRCKNEKFFMVGISWSEWGQCGLPG